MHADDIDDVLDILTAVVADTTAVANPRGFFAALYRQVTLEVRRGIVSGDFDDGARMRVFDAAFANRYFSAYESSPPPTRSWRVTFDAIASSPLIVMQNLLLGINAHINLDLAVVTGTSFHGRELDDFRADYDRINGILAELVPRIRGAIVRFSPLFGLLGPFDDGLEPILDFSFERARDSAWAAATLISAQNPQTVPLLVAQIDAATSRLGQLIARPDEPAATLLRLIRRTESSDVPAIITALDTIAVP
ncbi:DUF5995 family protein [Rhodococcus phenolicus]|uniref:DUF5995 family protein n=1 Tax=Rhodococcus phenolicus TaxID=263849 RepID=UPI0008342C79|nr:DUF5995 family protein [Rhodococcus phenolicus]